MYEGQIDIEIVVLSLQSQIQLSQVNLKTLQLYGVCHKKYQSFSLRLTHTISQESELCCNSLNCHVHNLLEGETKITQGSHRS